MKNIATLITLAAAAFVPAANAQVFGQDTRISNIAAVSAHPDVAGSGANVYIVWTESTGAGEIYLVRSTDGGGSFEAPQNLSNDPRNDQLPIVVAGGTEVHVFWTDDVTNGAIYYRRSTSSGAAGTFSPTVVLVPNAANIYARPGSAIIDSNGCVHLAWYGDKSNGNFTGYGAAFHIMSCDSGANWSAQNEVTLIDGTVDTEQPRLAEINKTIFMQVRTSRNGVPQGGWPPMDQYLYRGTIPATKPVIAASGPDQVAWQHPAQKISRGLPDELANTYSGSLATGANSALHTMFWAAKSGNNLYYRRGFPNGAGFGPAVEISGHGANHLEWDGNTFERNGYGFAEDSAQRLHVVYGENLQTLASFQVGRLWYRCSNDQGVTWQPRTFASNTASQTGMVRATYVPAINKMHIVWTDFRDGNFGAEIYYKWFAPGPCVDPNADADNDGIPNGIEALEGRNVNAKDNDVFGSPRLFTMQQYRDFLSREGDIAGINGWVSLINAGTYSRLDVINSFFNSQEFNGFVAPVVRLYFATYLRVPDYAGLVFNAGLIRSGTLTLTQLADFFAASPEFTALYGSLNNTQFVTLLYNNVLNRAPDPAGLNGWVSLLNGGMSRGQVLLGFSESPEYQAAQFNQVYVTMMYVGMLRRSPEPTGYNGWLAYLNTPGNTPLAMINGFYLSTEYHNRFLP